MPVSAIVPERYADELGAWCRTGLHRQENGTLLALFLSDNCRGMCDKRSRVSGEMMKRKFKKIEGLVWFPAQAGLSVKNGRLILELRVEQTEWTKAMAGLSAKWKQEREESGQE